MCSTPMMWADQIKLAISTNAVEGKAPNVIGWNKASDVVAGLKKSNLMLQEIMKITYWWCADLRENQIKSQLRINDNAVVDWSMFCREICLAYFEAVSNLEEKDTSAN